MSLVVVGSVALDTVETPAGKRGEILGGSAVYFSLAARLFGGVSLVGVVGEDFPRKHLLALRRGGIDARGLAVVPGKTFRWSGRYAGDMGSAETVGVALNVFGEFDPELPEEYRRARYLFLANGSPVLQRKVVAQVSRPRLVFCDTMNHWIRDERDDLNKLIEETGGVVLNLDEARLLTGRDCAVAAARAVAELGAKRAIVKKGEHGALVLSGRQMCIMPAYPTEKVVDPTGAGDSFAGGMMGYLAATGDLSFRGLRRAAAYGTVTASITVEAFGVDALWKAKRSDLDRRLARLRKLVEF